MTTNSMLGSTIMAANWCRDNRGFESCPQCSYYKICDNIRTIKKHQVGEVEESTDDVDH